MGRRRLVRLPLLFSPLPVLSLLSFLPLQPLPLCLSLMTEPRYLRSLACRQRNRPHPRLHLHDLPPSVRPLHQPRRQPRSLPLPLPRRHRSGFLSLPPKRKSVNDYVVRGTCCPFRAGGGDCETDLREVCGYGEGGFWDVPSLHRRGQVRPLSLLPLFLSALEKRPLTPDDPPPPRAAPSPPSPSSPES